jgi:WD40 repeat protein
MRARTRTRRDHEGVEFLILSGSSCLHLPDDPLAQRPGQPLDGGDAGLGEDGVGAEIRRRGLDTSVIREASGVNPKAPCTWSSRHCRAPNGTECSDAGKRHPCGRRRHSLGSCPGHGAVRWSRGLAASGGPGPIPHRGRLDARSRNRYGMRSVGTMDGRMTVGSPQDAGPLRLTGPLQGSVWAVAAATLPNGTVVVAGGDSQGRVAWWNGASGELLSDARSADPGVMRWITAVTLPDGRIRFATAGSKGTVQLWDGAQGVTTARAIPSETGNVWSMATLTLPGPTAVLFTGGDDGWIRRWDVETGEPVGEPFGDHAGAVRAMAAGPLIDGMPTLVTGGDDGTVRRWDAETGQRLGPPRRSARGAVWGVTVARLPSVRPILVSCSNDAVLCRWDDTGARLGAPIVVGPGALVAVVAVTLPNGRVALVCGGVGGWLSCWDARTGEQVGRPQSASDRGLVSLATVPAVDGRVRLVFGDNDGSVTVAPVPWGSEPRMPVPVQVDSTRVQDGLGRRVLAAHLGALLGELATASDSSSAVVHVDGPWGAGKSTLVRLLVDDEQAHGPDWTPPLVVDYEAWRECAIAPVWWSLAAAIEKEVRRSQSWAIRAVMPVWSVVVRTIRSPATLTALAVFLVGVLVSTFFLSSWVQTVATVAAGIVGLIGVSQVVGRALFWHSAPFGRLHLHTEDNPLGQVADMIGWLRGWAPRVPAPDGGGAGQDRRRPLLLVIDDLDRCPAERVVKILETVHTILRQPPARSRPRRREPARLFVLVLADGRWVRQAFASRFPEFQNPRSATRDLGSDFAQKVFDHVVLVPDLFAEQVSAYLDGMVGARADGAADRPGVSPDQNTVRTGNDDASLREDRAPADATPLVRDQENAEIDRVRQEATAAATDARSDHLLHTYTGLMPANPRMIKRIANALGMLRAVQAHVRHTENDDAMARAAILLIRFPVLAAQLRLDDLPNGADPCWDLPGVRDVLGECSLESLARCLGRADPPSTD